MTQEIKKLTPKDYKSDQEVRWCPGCGDYAIMNSIQKAMAELDYKKEDVAIISGIGCSSRFPYYMSTYGFHSIHGRAAAIASGVKTANPNLHVWQISGDGDAMAIGGNHFIHAIRRNIDINMIIFNNEIYGLTKGQYSPTSPLGKKTKTSPFGTVEHPFHPGELVIGSQGKFFARTIDYNVKLSTDIFILMAKHKGTSVVEVLQNCVIYNDGCHAMLTDKEHKEDRTIVLKHGERMLFGKEKDRGIILDGLKLRVVKLSPGGFTENDLLVHDAHENNPGIHTMLANMRYPDYPVALGVIRDITSVTYDESVANQIDKIKKNAKFKSMRDLIYSGNTWEIKE
ncbi:MAG: 2-oxoacid:ferredoxin oxidoreductase subunit beta [Salinivirgaceae bacterium]|jgi:2-oxoglutarate ferredoxin oxidoreductase subunit beta|nr:2-oxoacid:ferredoxin oxidoreductase subunit beta [Salinivirgaceae bacterium]